jgi:adenylate cyclase
MDIKAARGSLINQTLRRVLGLSQPATAGDASAAPADGAGAGTGVAPVSGLPAEALDVVGQAVLAFDIGGRLFYANAAASRMLGETAVRPGASGLDDVFGGLNEVIAEEIREVLASGEARSGLTIDFAADAGHWLPCVFDLRTTPDPSGRGNGVLVVIEDKSVEQSLRKVLDQTMSASVTEAIVGGQALGLEGKETDATILFSDIRAFTSLCESLSASALVALLNEYFTFMADVIRGNRGIIDKYIGDAIMALFGVPNANARTADDAVQAAIGMIQALDLFNDDRRRAGDAVFQIGIGIANGPVIAGTLGSPERMNYTVIGDAVNLASRIEGLTKAYGAEILICGSTSDAMAGSTPRRRVDVVRVKGQETATPLVQVLNRAEPGAALNRSLAAYAEALEAYEAGRFAEAEKGFANVVRLDPADATAAMMRERCRLLRLRPPTDWAGVWKLDSK